MFPANRFAHARERRFRAAGGVELPRGTPLRASSVRLRILCRGLVVADHAFVKDDEDPLARTLAAESARAT